LGNVAGTHENVAQDIFFIFGDFFKGNIMDFGYDQDMDRSFWIDILKGNDPVVFINYL
jgi:hypothetical protein